MTDARKPPRAADGTGGVVTNTNSLLLFNGPHTIGIAFDEACGNCNGVSGSMTYASYFFDFAGQSTIVSNIGGFSGASFSEVAVRPLTLHLGDDDLGLPRARLHGLSQEGHPALRLISAPSGDRDRLRVVFSVY
jgi:hypothetical protein